MIWLQDFNHQSVPQRQQLDPEAAQLVTFLEVLELFMELTLAEIQELEEEILEEL